MSKACFDQLQPKPVLVKTHVCKVNDADGNSLHSLGTTTCTFEFPKIFQQQFIVCKHLLYPIILGLDLSYNYLIVTDWFSTNQFHLHQGPQSIVVLDLHHFLLHINQISTLSTPHILVKTISKVTILSGTLEIVPTALNSMPKPNFYYNFTEMSQKSKQNLFCCISS